MTDNDFNPVVEIQAEVQVTPTLELQAEVDMGSLASERNAEAWAVGQRGGVDVSSTDQTYHNNAKYWAEQAEQTVVGSIIDDTSTALNKVWSAHKVSEEFAETNGEVTDLKSAIDSIDEAVFNRNETMFANYGNDETNTLLTSSYRWFYPIPIQAKDIITKIGLTVYGSYTSNNTPLNIDFYDLDNGTLKYKKTISTIIPTDSAGEYYEISCSSYVSEKPTYVAFRQARSILSYTGPAENDSIKMLYAATGVSDISFSSLTIFNGRINIDIVGIHVTSKVIYDTNVIHIGEGLQYEEIQDALDSITDDTASNPYTFIIHPKVYSRFSTIRKLSETYPWSNAPIRYISMIGVDKYHCIVKDDKGNYTTPPAEILVNGLIKNISFIATHDNQDTSATQGSYAVHIDATPVGNVGYNMQFENCYFESDQTAGVGIGLHNSAHLSFKNCDIVSKAVASYAPYERYTSLAYLGALCCHASTTSTDTDQILTIDGCTAMAKENKVYNFATNENCNMTIKAYNNTFWCEETEQANGYKGTYAHIFGANHGNNASALNAT